MADATDPLALIMQLLQGPQVPAAPVDTAPAMSFAAPPLRPQPPKDDGLGSIMQLLKLFIGGGGGGSGPGGADMGTTG